MMPTKKKKKVVLLVCGLPGAGKSTLAKYIAERIPNTKIIEYDSYSHNDASVELWRTARPAAVQELLSSLTSSDYDILIMDDNFYLRSMRKDIAKVLREHDDVHFGTIYLQTPVSVCLQRNRTRQNNNISEEIIRSMAERMEPPEDSDRFYWDANLLQLETNDNNFPSKNDWDAIEDFLQHTVGPISYPTKPPPTTEPVVPSLAQRRDSYWRAMVNLIGTHYPHLAKDANMARKHCLQSKTTAATLDDFLRYKNWVPERDASNIRKLLEMVKENETITTTTE